MQIWRNHGGPEGTLNNCMYIQRSWNHRQARGGVRPRHRSLRRGSHKGLFTATGCSVLMFLGSRKSVLNEAFTRHKAGESGLSARARGDRPHPLRRRDLLRPGIHRGVPPGCSLPVLRRRPFFISFLVRRGRQGAKRPFTCP